MGSSGRLSRSRGTFGSEHRWYQPTRVADQAAALTQEALAAAAAEQQVDHANWLLKSSPVARSKSAQRCTFGSELRWWERFSQPQQPVSGWPNSDQAALHAEEYGYPASPEHRGHYIGRSSPVRGAGLPRQGSTFGTEPRGLDADAPRPAPRPQASAVAAAVAAAALPEQSISPAPAGSSQRSVSVDRGLRQAQGSVSPERAWWSADQAPSPDSALQRIQLKHTQIQSLAAVINQRPTSARTHTLKSTFGSEARWWENPIAERASSPSSQQSAAASRSSPDRLGRSSAHRVSSPDRSIGQKLHSTFGSERRWWENKGHSTAAASQPQLQQPDAEHTDTAVKAVAALWSPRQRSTSPDLVKPAASSCSDADRWWQGSQERGSLEGSSPQRRSEPIERARAPLRPPTSHPQSTSSSVQQGLIDRLHAQPWNTASVQAEPQIEARTETSSRSRHDSARPSAGSLSPAARAESTRLPSRSLSPSGSMQHITQICHRSSTKSELQDTLRRRYAFLLNTFSCITLQQLTIFWS